MPARNAARSAESICTPASLSRIEQISSSANGRLLESCREQWAGRFLLVGGVRLQEPLERRDTTGAELASGAVPELVHRLFGRTRRSVDPGGQHRIERVRDVDDAGTERDVL